MSGSDETSSSGHARPYTGESVSIRLVGSSNEEHVIHGLSSSEGGSDIMQQFHQDVIEKMRKDKDMSEKNREKKKWTLTNELRKLTQGVNLKYDEAKRKNTSDAENFPLPGYKKVSGKVETTSLMPPIASGKSKSMSAFSKSDLGVGEGCSWRAPQLEDDLQLHNLVELMKVFHEFEEKGSNGMNMTDFQHTMANILGEEGDPRVATLFMKIDVDSVGKVNWEKFCNYIVREYQERQLMQESLVKDLYKENINVIYK